MARNPKGNYKALIMLIKPPQLQLFKDGITITAMDVFRKYMLLKIINVTGQIWFQVNFDFTWVESQFLMSPSPRRQEKLRINPG